MVIRPHPNARRRGMLMIEIVVAIAILTIAVWPLARAFRSDTQLLKAAYQRSVAMEIVDGELEILAATDWRGLPEGSAPYTVNAKAAVNLPPGRFTFTRAGNHLKLEWSSDTNTGVGKIVREVTLP